MSRPHDPLTPEERELAAQLSKLGPHGGPSPSLDARILAAARAAVEQPAAAGAKPAPRTRSHWPLGMGVAASVLLAAGVAWQLRPTHEVLVASEVPADTPAAAVVAAAPAADAAPAPPAPPEISEPLPAPMEAPAPAAMRSPKPPAAADAAGPARKNAEAAARQEPAPRRSPLSLIPAVPGVPVAADAPPPPPPQAAPQAFPEATEPGRNEAARAFRSVTPPSPPAPAAPAAQASAEQAHEGFQARAAEARREQQRAAGAREAEDNTTLDSIMVTGSRVRTEDERKAASKASAPVTMSAPMSAPSAAAGNTAEYGTARSTLRRTDLQLPVDEDARLAPDEWLDRIRLRRDLGDAANATRSLHLFVQQHPFQRIPDDLQPLLPNL